MPANERRAELTGLIAGAALVVAAAAATVLVLPSDDTPRQAGSSYAASPEGAKAAFLVLQQSGWTVERSFDPIAGLRVTPRRTVLVLASPRLEPSEQDRRALAAFVEQGGTVVAGGAQAAEFLPGLGAGGAAANGADSLRAYTPGAPGPLNRGIAAIRMRPPPSRVAADPTHWRTAFAAGTEPGVLTATAGAGTWIWWASTDPLSNAEITAPGHLTLLLNALGPPGERTVLWDERYHGYGRTLWSYVVQTPLPWGLAQIALVAGLALFTHGRRHGPVRPRVTIPRTSPLEFVDTMGGLYERAHLAAAAVESAGVQARRRLASSAGVPSSSQDEVVAAALAQRFGIEASRCREVLSRATQAAREPSISEAEALRVTAELQRLVQDINQASGRRG